MDENLMIERDAVPPRLPKKKRQPMPDFTTLEMPNLGDKLQEHFDIRGSPSKMVSDLVAKLAVPLYFFTITTTWYLGMFVVMPVLYRDAEDPALFNQRVFMVVIYLELMVNWLCIRYVDSSYLHYLKSQWVKNGKKRFPSYGGESSKDDSLMKLLENGSGGGRLENGLHENGNVARENTDTPWKPPFRPPSQTTYPYWSWVPCYVCEVMRPPRCHHCPLCQTCVLKRDHHCFFAGSCVGWRNQRHFLIFSLWALFGCCYASWYGVSFFFQELWPGMRWFDLFAPVTLIRCVLGYVSGLACLCVAVESLLIYFIVLSFTFVNEHVQLIYRGVTGFEVSGLKKTVEVRNSRRLSAKIRSVLGRWWLLNLVFPLHWVFEPREDPEHWPLIKVHRN